ncbi:MAG: condensation domain-containing protein, partial [Planctomycetota bacterium]
MNERLASLSPEQKRELLKRLLEKKRQARESSIPPSTEVPQPAEFPLSAGQQALWFAFQENPSATAYNVFLPSRFRSPIDLDKLRRATESLVARHASLRTTFGEEPSNGSPIQRVAKSGHTEFRVVDCRGWDEEKRKRHVLAETHRSFDLTNGPLLRIACFQAATDDTVVIATTHHIVVDFWSLVMLMTEVEQLYLGKPLPAPQNQYRDFVLAQETLLRSDSGAAQREHWMRELAGICPRLE